jgi:ribosomal protein S16
MARGRFISNYIIEDREMNELSNDTCRLAYVFLITLADREGRITGELGYLTSKLFPRRREITLEMVRGFIQEWADAGFLVWYEDKEGKRALQLINFEKHQRGLRKDREPESEFENPKSCKIIAGELPKEENPKPVKELKDKELKDNNNSNVNVNVKPAKKDGANPALIRQNDGKMTENELEAYFIELTGLYKPSEHLQAKKAINWENALTVWEQVGATKADVKEAVDASDKAGMTLVSTTSITSFIKSAIARRKRGVKPAKDETVDEAIARMKREEAQANGKEIIDG